MPKDDPSSGYMTGIWGRIKVCCLNHEEPKEMKLMQNLELVRSPFYGCSEFFPEMRGDGEPPCPNRLNADDYQGVVMKFLGIIKENPIETDLTGYRYVYRGTRQKINVRCVKYTDKEIVLGIWNSTVLGQQPEGGTR